MGIAHMFMSLLVAMLAAATARKKSTMLLESLWRQHTSAMSSAVRCGWLMSSCMVATHICHGNALCRYTHTQQTEWHGQVNVASRSNGFVKKSGRKCSLVIGICLAMFCLHANKHRQSQ